MSKQRQQTEEEERETFRAAFEMFDKDKNGSINATELKTVMESLNIRPTDDEIKDMINEVDDNGNGNIDFDEFCEMMKKMGGPSEKSKEEELLEAFRVFDQDGNGFISRQELKDMMKNLDPTLGESEINDMMREADDNGDGKISYKEFVKLMCD